MMLPAFRQVRHYSLSFKALLLLLLLILTFVTLRILCHQSDSGHAPETSVLTAVLPSTAYSLTTESVIAAPSSTADSSEIAISSVPYLSVLGPVAHSLPFSFYVQPFENYTIYQIQLTSFPLPSLPSFLSTYSIYY